MVYWDSPREEKRSGSSGWKELMGETYRRNDMALTLTGQRVAVVFIKIWK